MAISEAKIKIVIDNYFRTICNVDTSIREAFEKGFRIGVMKGDAGPTNGWISVEDRLPDKNGQYLCWFGKNRMAKGAAIATYLEMRKSFGSLESLETYPNVTHWMPIPEPPKEEETK